MDRLPLELFDTILQFCVYSSRKNDVLKLRFVCRAFDRILKPYVCRTLGFDISRLKLSGTAARLRKGALKQIGDDCKGLYIDMRMLRDKDEVEYLIDKISILPHMEDFIAYLQTNCLMSDRDFSITTDAYKSALFRLLSTCRQVERLRVQFPSRLVKRQCRATSALFMITILALARRPQGSAALKVLVLDDIPSAALLRYPERDFWVQNALRIFSSLEHFSLTLDFYHPLQVGRTALAYGIWTLIQQGRLKSLCLAGVEPEPHCSLKQTRPQIMAPGEWMAHGLCEPPSEAYRDPNCLRRLELKGLEMTPDALLAIVFASRDSLEELYLKEIFLKVRVSRHHNADSTEVLWTGLPNERPPLESTWMADNFRRTLRKLRICRASFLGYDHYLDEEEDEATSLRSDFDLVDPCGLGRSVSQRFVEIVMGVRQPDDPRGHRPVRYLPKRVGHDERFARLTDRPARVDIADHDANAYQLEAGGSSASRWCESLDGVFPTCNPGNQAEWDHVSKTARDALAEANRLAALRISDSREIPE